VQELFHYIIHITGDPLLVLWHRQRHITHIAPQAASQTEQAYSLKTAVQGHA